MQLPFRNHSSGSWKDCQLGTTRLSTFGQLFTLRKLSQGVAVLAAPFQHFTTAAR